MLAHRKMAKFVHDRKRGTRNGLSRTFRIFRRTGQVICPDDDVNRRFGSIVLDVTEN